MGVEESLRDRLVTVGVELLEQVGVGQLGLRAIARHAGVSHGAPRRYFPTHAALLAAVAGRGFADLRTRFGAHVGQPPRAQIEQMVLDYVRFAAERPEMFTLMFRHDLLEGSGENLRQQSLPMYRLWADLVAKCMPDSSVHQALLLWTSVHGVAVLVANRSLELIAPNADPAGLVGKIIDQYLGSAPI
ncbi:TetR/AcrR family transcriptional regulator [Nocardia sp. NEAU-G5]|uniref:TetR/AcrR family transcriptional regulator n=1 Tax=Nocardia albiluteola TaxID=2842303 RepID=A0ABS6B923_9NOCA|nr:TetR/AcrR family transcriptional regulator [Nocardia albiluteola]MBU3065921.1 TetR/AcrR family transcriptional regulator [Nocardia albiluteola]